MLDNHSSGKQHQQDTTLIRQDMVRQPGTNPGMAALETQDLCIRHDPSRRKEAVKINKKKMQDIDWV